MTATGLGFLLMAFSRASGMWVALPILGLVGLTNSVYLTQVNTLLQQKVPDGLRGRVMSLYALCWNLLPLGGLVSGALAAAVDARFAVLVGAILPCGEPVTVARLTVSSYGVAPARPPPSPTRSSCPSPGTSPLRSSSAPRPSRRPRPCPSRCGCAGPRGSERRDGL
jgi:MFS family permease